MDPSAHCRLMGPSYLIPFAPSDLHIVHSRSPIGIEGAMRLVPGAAAALPGPMFRICDSSASGYADATCGDPSYLLRDTTRGIDEASEYPDRGGTFSVSQGVVHVARGASAVPCAPVAVQGYPTVVWDGQNEAPTRGEATSSTWRSALVLLQDGRLAFALARATFPEFGRWLVESGATHAIYTDGGGSGNIVSGGGLVGSSEGRPLPSFLVCTSGKSVLVPATVAALAVMLAYALSGDSELVH